MVANIFSTVDGDPAIPGTYIDLETYPDVGPPDEIEQFLVFYQIHGDDITIYTGDRQSGSWSESTVPIPDE